MSETTLALGRRSFLASGSAFAAIASAGCATSTSPVAQAQDFPRTRALVETYVAARKVSGVSIAVKLGQAPVRYFNNGVTALDGAHPADDRALYRIYSMSKPITGIAAMILVGENKLRLDQPIADILPEFANMRVLVDPATMETRPAAGPILVRHLLTHSAGFSYDINTTGPLPPIYRAHGIRPGGRPGDLLPNPLLSLEDLGHRLAPLPLGYDPGTRQEYSLGLDMTGLVIQRVSGMPFERFLRTRLFGPLGMDDTDFYVPAAKLDRFATNYRVTPEGMHVEDAPPNTPYARREGMPSGGAGIISSAHDYIRFCAMLLNNGTYEGVRIMAPETVALACSNIAPTGLFTPQNDGFGAGMRVVRPESARDGMPAGQVSWGGAAGTTMWVDRARQFALVFMTQFMPQDAYPVWDELRHAAYADLAAA